MERMDIYTKQISKDIPEVIHEESYIKTYADKFLVLKRGKNKQGEILILSKSVKNDLFTVWITSTNYSHGQLVKSVKYIERNLEQSKAEAIFKRRTV